MNGQKKTLNYMGTIENPGNKFSYGHKQLL